MLLEMLLAVALLPQVQPSTPPDEKKVEKTRLDSLEERLNKIEESLPPQEKKPGAGSMTGEGFKFASDDGNFVGSINGRLLTHYRHIIDRPDEENGAASAPLKTLPNTFFVRQARLEANINWYKDFTGKVQYDVATGFVNQSTGAAPSNVTGTLRDAFVAWHQWKEVSFRFGQFFEPLSQEDVSSTRFIDFAERSVMNRLLPGREIGAAVYGSLFEDKLAYEVMACNGNALLNDQGRNVNDGNDEKELAARLYFFPIEGLRLGVAGSIGSVDDVGAGGFDLITTELSVMWLDGGGVTFDGKRQRIVGNLSYANGPFCVRAEIFAREDELKDTTSTESDLESMGYYAYATWVVTGEKKVVENRLAPSRNFLDEGGIGAIELGARYGHVEVTNAEDAGLIGPPSTSGSSESVDVVTVGVNWWPVKYVRVTLNYIHEMYEDDIFFENGREEDSADGFIVRFQIDF